MTGPTEARASSTGEALPSLGRIVHYVGKQGYNALRAAVVTADVDTLDPRGVAAGVIPALSSSSHVHLWVFTPGESGGFTEYNVGPGSARARGGGLLAGR